MRLRMTMAALALALIGAGEASAKTLYVAPGARRSRGLHGGGALHAVHRARVGRRGGHAGARARPLRRRGQPDLRRPRDARGGARQPAGARRRHAPAPAGSALRDVTVRGSADRVLVVRGTAERVEVTNSVAGPTTICEVHGTLANSACYSTGTATAVVGDGALRHVTALSAGIALQATGATTAVSSILAGATDFSGNVTLDHSHTGDRDTLFPQLAAGVLLPPAAAPTIDAGAPALPGRARPLRRAARRGRRARPGRARVPAAGAGGHDRRGRPDRRRRDRDRHDRRHRRALPRAVRPGCRLRRADRRGRGHGRGPGRPERTQAADHVPLPLRGGQRRRRDGRRRPHVHDARRAGRHADTDGHAGGDRDARPDAVAGGHRHADPAARGHAVTEPAARSPRSRSRSPPTSAAGRRARTPCGRRSPRAGRSPASRCT